MKQLDAIYKHSQRDEWVIFYKDERNTYVRIGQHGDIIEYPIECFIECFTDPIDRYRLRYPQYQHREIREVENYNFLYRVYFIDGSYLQWFRYMGVPVIECTEVGMKKG